MPRLVAVTTRVSALTIDPQCLCLKNYFQSMCIRWNSSWRNTPLPLITGLSNHARKSPALSFQQYISVMARWCFSIEKTFHTSSIKSSDQQPSQVYLEKTSTMSARHIEYLNIKWVLYHCKNLSPDGKRFIICSAAKIRHSSTVCFWI